MSLHKTALPVRKRTRAVSGIPVSVSLARQREKEEEEKKRRRLVSSGLQPKVDYFEGHSDSKTTQVNPAKKKKQLRPSLVPTLVRRKKHKRSEMESRDEPAGKKKKLGGPGVVRRRATALEDRVRRDVSTALVSPVIKSTKEDRSCSVSQGLRGTNKVRRKAAVLAPSRPMPSSNKPSCSPSPNRSKPHTPATQKQPPTKPRPSPRTQTPAAQPNHKTITRTSHVNAQAHTPKRPLRISPSSPLTNRWSKGGVAWKTPRRSDYPNFAIEAQRRAKERQARIQAARDAKRGTQVQEGEKVKMEPQVQGEEKANEVKEAPSKLLRLFLLLCLVGVVSYGLTWVVAHTDFDGTATSPAWITYYGADGGSAFVPSTGSPTLDTVLEGGRRVLGMWRGGVADLAHLLGLSDV